MKMSLHEVMKATRGKMILGNPQEIITGISTDTRTIRSGDLFVALRGEHHDGHDHIAQAFQKGAAGALVESLKPSERKKYPHVVVTKDSLKALGLIAKEWRHRFNIPVIAVTGSNGKTTTKDMIAAVLESKFRILKTEGNFNNWIGLPQTVFKLEPKFQKMILEMGMNHKGEIDWLAQVASPEVAVITHIGRAHIENFKNQYGIACAKGELLRHISQKGLAVLNADDSYFEALKKMTRARVMSFGFSKKATAQILSIDSKHLDKTFFEIKLENKKMGFEIPLGGAHNVHNALAAIIVGRYYGVSFEKIKSALKNYQPEKKRMEILHLTRGIDVINDSYNANPDSVSAAIHYLKSFKGRTRVLVLGDMFELGKNAATYHKEIGEMVAKSGIENLWVVGQKSLHTYKGAVSSGMKKPHVHHVKNIESLLPDFYNQINDGDLVLIKGSRGMKMERLTSALIKGGAH